MKKNIFTILIFMLSALLFGQSNSSQKFAISAYRKMPKETAYIKAFDNNVHKNIYVCTLSDDYFEQLYDSKNINKNFYKLLKSLTSGTVIKTSVKSSTLYIGLNPTGGYTFIFQTYQNFYKFREILEQNLGFTITEFFNNKKPKNDIYKNHPKPEIDSILK